MRKKPISLKVAGFTFKKIFQESDRGCVLAVGTLLDSLLGEFHETRIKVAMFPGKTGVFKKLSAPYAPLSSFAGKIQLAYAYGLIGEADYQDLDRIRNLRNEVAHGAFDFSLDNEGVVSFVNKLTAHTRVKQTSFRLAMEPTEKAINSETESNGKRRFLVNGFALYMILIDSWSNEMIRLRNLTSKKS